MSKNNKNNKNNEEETYMSEGMLYGVALGSIVGAMISRFTEIMYLPICLSGGMMIGLAIGSNIKKKK